MGHKLKSAEIVMAAYRLKTVVPGFNIPYLPMMEPVVRALADTKTFGMIMVARLEWTKFKSGGVRQISEEYRRVCNESYTRLHLDHVPVIDEDNLDVGYAGIISEALGLGYDSVTLHEAEDNRRERTRSCDARRNIHRQIFRRGCRKNICEEGQELLSRQQEARML